MNGRPYRFNGGYGQPGQKERPGVTERRTKVNGNKGVLKAERAVKRAEADIRNAATPNYRRRAFARENGFQRVSDMIRAGVFPVVDDTE